MFLPTNYLYNYFLRGSGMQATTYFDIRVVSGVYQMRYRTPSIDSNKSVRDNTKNERLEVPGKIDGVVRTKVKSCEHPFPTENPSRRQRSRFLLLCEYSPMN